jgi:hypothetical protein
MEERDTYMPLADLDTEAKRSLPKIKPELVKAGVRVIVLSKGKEISGTVTYTSNFQVFIRPDEGVLFKTNMRNLIRRAAPLGEEGYRGQVKITARLLGRKISFKLTAETTAANHDEACKRLMDGARLMFPVSCERVVSGIVLAPDVVE